MNQDGLASATSRRSVNQRLRIRKREEEVEARRRRPQTIRAAPSA
jgi:hypothetical protein